MTKAKKSKKADKAYLKAIEEIEKDRINEIKGVVKQVLEGIVEAQKARRAADEKLALLRQDLSDIRCGKIERIKARHQKRKEEKKWVPFEADKLEDMFFTPSALGPFSIHGTDANSTWTVGTSTNSDLGRIATNGKFTLSNGTTVSIN